MPATMSWATNRTSLAPTIWKVPELSTSTGYAAISPGSASCSAPSGPSMGLSRVQGMWALLSSSLGPRAGRLALRLGSDGLSPGGRHRVDLSDKPSQWQPGSTAEQAPFFYGAYFVSLGLAACWP